MTNKKTEQAKIAEYQHKKWQRVNWDIVKEVYLIRPDEISLENLAKEFNISPPHLKEIASAKNWSMQRRLWQNKTLLKTAERLTDKKAEIRARNIAVAEGALSLLAGYIKNKDLKASLSDVDKIVRLIEFLYGNADSRPDFASGIENLIKELGKDRAKQYKETKIIDEDRQITEGGENK